MWPKGGGCPHAEKLGTEHAMLEAKFDALLIELRKLNEAIAWMKAPTSPYSPSLPKGVTE